VDELREKLRALGYLEAGVDRYVLAPARHGRGAAAFAAQSSIRIGLLAALLLGPAAAIGVGLRLPGLLTGPRDALVVAAYLGALFGAGAAAVSLGGIWMASVAARTAEPVRSLRAARLAGILVGGACLVYLTLWWRAADPGGGNAGLWTLAALGVAVAISLLLGRTVITVATAAIAVAGGGALPTRRTGASWKFSAALAALAFAGATALLVATAPAPAAASRAADLTLTPTRLRLRLVGIDGFDAQLYRRLVGRGALTHLPRVLGAAEAAIAIGADRDPARVWTSIATGQPPQAHGIEAIETRRVAGVHGAVRAPRSPLFETISAATDLIRLSRPAIVTGLERREKTVWEVAEETGLRTAVINWWATWPATGARGIVLTDRAVLRLERGGSLDGEIAPPDLYESLEDSWADIRGAARARASDAFSTSPAGTAAVLMRSAELDSMLVALAMRTASPTLDLLAIYLPGLDIAQHALLADTGAASPSDLAQRVEGLERYYLYLDALLEPLLAPGAADLVVIIAHPGRVTQPADAVFALAGPPADPAATARGTLADIAPTILHALGIPISRELTGNPLPQLFSAEFRSTHQVRHVETYGRRAAPLGERGESSLDREALDRLRSLGYVR
jgi:hypothetical protein